MKDFPVSENKGTGKSLSIARFHLVATSLSPLCNLCVPLGNLWVVFSKRMRQNGYRCSESFDISTRCSLYGRRIVGCAFRHSALNRSFYPK